MHRLLGRVPGGVEGLCARFKEGLEQRGISLVQEPESTLGAVAYVEGLLALKAKFDEIDADGGGTIDKDELGDCLKQKRGFYQLLTLFALFCWMTIWLQLSPATA